MVRPQKKNRATESPSPVGMQAADVQDVGQPGWTTLAVLSGLLAAWTAAGSVGVLGLGLQLAATWALLSVSAVAGWPRGQGQGGGRALLLIVAVAGVACIGRWGTQAVLTSIVPLVLSVVALRDASREGMALRCTAFAAAVFALYRFLYLSAPVVWMAVDGLCERLTGAVGRLTGHVLWIGATFAGVDFVVLTGAWLAAFILSSPSPKRSRTAWAFGSLVAIHLLYLLLASMAISLAYLLTGDMEGTEEAPAWVEKVFPWYLPSAAALLHLALVAGVTRWSVWVAPRPVGDSAAARPRQGRQHLILAAGLVAIALAIAACASVCWGPKGLQGKKIVISKEGFLNWLKPEHDNYGRFAIGMYGMLPTYIRSLGADCLISSDLSEADLKDADVLMLIFPDDPWPEGQLERIWSFTRQGGSLLVMGEHTTRPIGGDARFNEVLAPTAMRVRFDSSTYAIGGWLQSYDPLAHPATIGFPDDRNSFGAVIGASVEARWPARPMIVGRWGWSDWGDAGGSAMMGNGVYDAGEKLGDQVLAAEQKLGAGRVVAFGDTSTLSNGINMGAHSFTARLLNYLANPVGGPHAAWRGVLCLLLVVGAIVLLYRAPVGWPAVLLFLVLAASHVHWTALNHRAMEVVPKGAPGSAAPVAYIDGSHLGMHSAESWRNDGLMGISMTFMRNGYQTLIMDRFDPERLKQAALFLSVAPMRAYTTSEIGALVSFVEGGGILICTVGYEDSLPSRDLLAAFGLAAGNTAADNDPFSPGTLPWGFFKSPYYNAGAYMTYVRFYAGWPVSSYEPDKIDIAYGRGNEPVALVRVVGRGKVVLVGDTGFAMNKNLEVESGAAFEGMRENSHFWRWFITYLNGIPLWVPPDPRASAPVAAEAAGS